MINQVLMTVMAAGVVLGGRLGVTPQSLTGMLVGLATPLSTLSMYSHMDGRGKVAKVAAGPFWSAAQACWPPTWAL